MTQMQKNSPANSGTGHSKKGEINPLTAGIAGAVVGAGVGVIGAMAMNDDKIRGKVEQAGRIISEKAGEYADNMKKEATSQFSEKAEETGQGVKKVVTGKN